MTKEQKFLLLVVLIVAGASVTYYYTSNDNAPQQPVTQTQQVTPVTATQPTPTNPSTNNTPTQPVQSATKKYSTDVAYQVPEKGMETIHVTVSLKNGVIEDLAFSYDTPGKRESKFNIGNFEKALPAAGLTGKTLSEVSLSRLGGASLTTKAFMEAIQKIDEQVKNG